MLPDMVNEKINRFLRKTAITLIFAKTRAQRLCIELVGNHRNRVFVTWHKLAKIKWASLWENRLFAHAKTKTQISFAVIVKLISAFVFATRIVQSLFLLIPKFQVSSDLLWLHSPVFVGPGRKARRPVFSQRGSTLLVSHTAPICLFVCLFYHASSQRKQNLIQLTFSLSKLLNIVIPYVWIWRLYIHAFNSLLYHHSKSRYSFFLIYFFMF